MMLFSPHAHWGSFAGELVRDSIKVKTRVNVVPDTGRDQSNHPNFLPKDSGTPRRRRTVSGAFWGFRPLDAALDLNEDCPDSLYARAIAPPKYVAIAASVADRIQDAALGWSLARRSRYAPGPPKSRSNTVRGLVSMGSGVLGVYPLNVFR